MMRLRRAGVRRGSTRFGVRLRESWIATGAGRQGVSCNELTSGALCTAGMKGRVFIGTSGWNYKSWAGGVFYPPGLKPALWLDYYSRHFRSVEVNNTFYRLPE